MPTRGDPVPPAPNQEPGVPPLDGESAVVLAKLVIDRVATSRTQKITPARPLREAVRIGPEKVIGSAGADHGEKSEGRRAEGGDESPSLEPETRNLWATQRSEIAHPELGTQKAEPVLLVLAAGKGTRFGQQPKCIQPVLGTPLARHSIDAFRTAVWSAEQRIGAGDFQTLGSTPPAIHPVAPLPARPSESSGVAKTRDDTACDAPPLRAVAPPPVRAAPGPTVIAVVGYRHEEVAEALGADNTFVRSENPTGGTAFAAFEAFSVPGLLEANPLLVVTMGDRIVPAVIFRRLLATHAAGGREADLTFLTARYEPPKHHGKGRVLRNSAGRVVRLIEQKDIAAEPDPLTQQALESLTEGNCPLYAIRAATLFRLLGELDNANAQGQYYLTDIVAAISREAGEIRTITTSPTDSEYDLLCSDVTRPQDLALLEGVLSRAGSPAAQEEIARTAAAILADRPPGQVASIARQLEELSIAAAREKLGYAPDQPVAIGISGGRLRVAFMHPDMGRFFGPAWQMPIGAADGKGDEQIVVLAQPADDRRLHLHPLDPKYRESVNYVATDDATMYPGAEVADWHSYEGFGTRMSETLLLSLGYFSDEEVEARQRKNQPLPPASLRVSSSMRRPFALVGNAIASLRTLREGHLGARVQAQLDREHFKGLRIACTGGIPQGGFSSSSALTVATKNALNSLFGLGIPPDLLVHLACQAEYGTGVRAGSLDQATEQKGRAGQGTLISSNPSDNYRILGTYKVPADRFRVIFPYTVERDRAAWRWSWGRREDGGRRAEDGGRRAGDGGQVSEVGGRMSEVSLPRRSASSTAGKGGEPEQAGTRNQGGETARGRPGPECTLVYGYAEAPIAGGPLTTGEIRKMTGKAAEIAAILTRLPLDTDFFKEIEADLVADGALEPGSRRWICRILKQLPLSISRDELQRRVAEHRDWYMAELVRVRGMDPESAGQKTDVLFASLFSGWREPVLRRCTQGAEGKGRELVAGVPLRAMLAYLFGEVAKNFHLIHHSEEWIEYVTRSQQGDRCVELDPAGLPDRAAMETELDWEKAVAGPARLDLWLERHGAVPYDYNQELDDATLSESAPPEFHRWAGGSFFRGLALIDLAEAMLKRAFGGDAVAVRVNAAGQGDYFQVHVDAQRAEVAEVKQFLRAAFYRRFGLSPEPDFVETNPGAGAVGVTLSRFDALPRLVRALRAG